MRRLRSAVRFALIALTPPTVFLALCGIVAGPCRFYLRWVGRPDLIGDDLPAAYDVAMCFGGILVLGATAIVLLERSDRKRAAATSRIEETEPVKRMIIPERYGPADIVHVDGVCWYDAPVPAERHRCWSQTIGTGPTGTVHRCACGGYSPDGRLWIGGNERRRPSEVAHTR